MQNSKYLTMNQLGRKRFFDLIIVSLSSITWLPILLICSTLILIFNGRPILYRSKRRIGAGIGTVTKFRTMVRNAAEICNRDNSPIENGIRFLNIPSSSPLYTPVGRLIERATLTELPQLLQVLAGKMTLVGNRPLPENVVNSLASVYSNVEERFYVPAGLTGPAQLVGRDTLSDSERLGLEAAYCRIASSGNTWQLDFMILYYTVLISAGLKRPMTLREVQTFLMSLSVPGTSYPNIEKLGSTTD
ncbi:MAG: sugar transferase [Gammaproteobacteria bacterium]|nr:sugar transferase [Pseudomonadales bacterium]